MPHPHEGLETLFDVRENHQLADDGIRRLRGNDARLGQPDVAALGCPLLGMPDRRALHGTLHGAGTAARAHIQAAQAHLIPDPFRVVIFGITDRVATPADDQVGIALVLEGPRVAQDAKYRIRNRAGIRQGHDPAVDDLVGRYR